MMTAEYSEQTNEELAALAKNNPDAVEKLVSQNEGLVILMASTFLKRNGFYNRYDLDDYSQICRMSIVKAVKNYDPDTGVRFATYAGRIMRNNMLRQQEKDNAFHKNNTEEYIEENDTSAEECDEEYGDAYDNDFERQRSYDLNILPSSYARYSKESSLIEQNKADTEAMAVRFNQYSALLGEIYEEKAQGVTKESLEKRKDKVLYLNSKEANHSWKYPIFYQALNELQIKKMLQTLLDERFNPAQREYLIYRFGLKDLTPKTLKETADHFYLSVSYAKKIEKEGLNSLREKCKKSIYYYSAPACCVR